jgi:hypothetical protein
MPNDCWNLITIATHENPNELELLIQNEFTHHIDEDGNPVYHRTVELLEKGKGGVILRLWSGWNPDFEWLEGLLDKYPSCWVKNEWSEEGGYAGVWVGCVKEGEKIIKRLEWDDLCIEAKHYLFLDEKNNKEEVDV